MRLDQLAAVLFPDFSRARLQKWVRSGELTVDGRVLKTTYRLNGGETLRLDALPEPQGEVLPQDIPLDIIHADDDIILINKPAGFPQFKTTEKFNKHRRFEAGEFKPGTTCFKCHSAHDPTP